MRLLTVSHAISWSGIRAAADSDCSDEVYANECEMFNYQPINSQPELEIETQAETFGHHRTRSSTKRAETIYS